MIWVICWSHVQQCVNVQEVREVQEVLWDPSYPEIRKGPMSQKRCARVGKAEERATHHGSRARIRSFYTIILSSKVLLNKRRPVPGYY